MRHRSRSVARLLAVVILLATSYPWVDDRPRAQTQGGIARHGDRLVGRGCLLARTVTVTNTATRGTRNTTTNGEGLYTSRRCPPLTGFEPVALLTTSKLWIVARKDLPANNPKEFVAWLKANPGKANAASVGVGSAAHVCLVDLANRSDTKFQFVTYRGGAPAVQALASGESDFSCLEGGQTLALYRSGKVKIIGVVSKTRWFGAPEVPTFEEGGVPGLELLFWHGLWAPKNTPKPVIAKLNHAVSKAFDDDWVKKRFAELGHTDPAAGPAHARRRSTPTTRPRSKNGGRS